MSDGVALMARIVTHRLMISAIYGLLVLAVAEPVAAADAFDGVYTGKRVLTKGSNQVCAAEEDVSVTIQGEVLTFTHSGLHDYPIGFYPRPDGSFGMTSTGTGGDVVTIHGRIVGDAIDADVVDRDCQYHWHLKRARTP